MKQPLHIGHRRLSLNLVTCCVVLLFLFLAGFPARGQYVYQASSKNISLKKNSDQISVRERVEDFLEDLDFDVAMYDSLAATDTLEVPIKDTLVMLWFIKVGTREAPVRMFHQVEMRFDRRKPKLRALSYAYWDKEPENRKAKRKIEKLAKRHASQIARELNDLMKG